MNDLISRRAAIDALKAIRYGLWEIDIPSPTVPEHVEHHEQIKNMMEITDGWIKKLKEQPSAKPDLSGYSDRLWKAAYERGKAEAEPRWIPLEDKPPKEPRSYWVCTDTGYQCSCRWTNNVYGLGESDRWGWSIFDIPQYSKVVAYMPLPQPYERSEDE